jgi:FixJ family two-component response regulator
MEPPNRILVVDDDESFLLTTVDLLKEEGFAVDCAPNGSSGRKCLEGTRYDVLISDIRMPGNTDLGMVRALPELNAGLPVILVTGFPSLPTAIQALECAVLAYLVKPIDFDALLAQVQRGVALRKVQQVVRDSSARSRQWAEEMAALIQSMMAAPGGIGDLPVNQLLGIMVGHLAQSLTDLKSLVELRSGDRPQENICSVQNCPRLEAYEQLFQEGIKTLEKTRGVYKSKELGDLRQSMERAVAEISYRQ